MARFHDGLAERVNTRFANHVDADDVSVHRSAKRILEVRLHVRLRIDVFLT